MLSVPKKELPDPPGGMIEVGEGRTSLKRDGGSLRSVFQMAVPQGKLADPCDRPIVDDVECEPQAPAPVSAEGVLGLDPVGDIELLAKDSLRGRLMGWDVSLSHDDRRTGFCGGAVVYEASWR